MPTAFYHNVYDDIGEARSGNSFHLSASVILCVCCLPICIVVIIVATTTTSNFHDNHPVIWSIVAVTSVVSTIITIVIWKRLRTTGQEGVAYRIEDVAIKPKLLFLWIFGFARIFSSTLELAVGFYCMQHKSKQMFAGEIFLSVFTNFSEISFTITQLCFLSSYSACKLKADGMVNFGLSTIIVTHLVQWFEMIFTTLARNDLINVMPQNETNNTCFHSPEFKNFEKDIIPYTEPMSTEYGLLAVGMVLRLASFLDNSGPTSDLESTHTERTPLLCVHYFGTTAKIEKRNTPALETEMKDQHQFQIPSFYCCLLAAFIICLPILVTIILNAYEEASLQFGLGVVQFLFKVELTTLIIITCYLWYVQFGQQNISDRKYDGKLILLMSTAGTVSHFAFGLVAGIIIENEENSSIATFLILQKILEIFVVVIQTYLILKSQRLRVVHSFRTTGCISVDKMFHVFFLIRVIMWIADSYIGKNTEKIMPIESKVYGDKYWKAINDVLYPVTMFYLFHTAIDFYQMYKKYEKSF
ncbi:uncharacterized protein LOC133179456 [Saccostrea echinata]|uniref:uncharacterized protein LOC133179456 n=1 Tax=Saccostrea echinata TaxID=191078 RepID=UPI002A7F1753|nr:uncharacterized protein LOC133179456 [Saccostrea echinata]